MKNDWIKFDIRHYYTVLDNLYIIYWEDDISSSILITYNPNNFQTFFMRENEFNSGNLFPEWKKNLISLLFSERFIITGDDFRLRVFRFFKL